MSYTVKIRTQLPEAKWKALDHDPVLRDAYAQGARLQAEQDEANRWHRSCQILSMALAVSVVVNIVAILWR
jgi:hypothetical protein